MTRNIAFKCTYNDSLGDGRHAKIGFNGTCSDKNIKRNIEEGRSLCNNSECKGYYNNNFKDEAPKNPCYESNIFRNWEYDAGWDHNGVHGNKARKIKNTGIGQLALLTTVFPDGSEKERKIFGCYRIGKIIDVDEEATKIIAGEETKIRFNYEETEKLNFWNYYSSQNSPDKCFWGTDIFRYLDEEVIPFLNYAYKIVKSPDKKKKIINLLNFYSEMYNKKKDLADIVEKHLEKTIVKLEHRVKIKDLSTNKIYEYKIVNSDQVDFNENIISKKSPIGSALLNQKINSIVEIELPGGLSEYKIIEIE